MVYFISLFFSLLPFPPSLLSSFSSSSSLSFPSPCPSLLPSLLLPSPLSPPPLSPLPLSPPPLSPPFLSPTRLQRLTTWMLLWSQCCRSTSHNLVETSW